MSHAKEKLQTVRDYWNQKILVWEASRYGRFRIFDPFSWPLRIRFRRAQKLLHSLLKEDIRILELGCGSGRLAQSLARSLPAYYRGVDISDVAIRKAFQRQLGPNFEFFAGDAVSAAEDSDEFHLSIFLGLMDWLSDDQMNLLFSSLKSPSLIFSFSMQRSGISSVPYIWHRKITDRHSDGYGARIYKKEAIRGMVEGFGYSVKSMEKTDLFSPSCLVYATRKTHEIL